jgi:crotonobetainyl-CoA:carnitine CoA-transferase CaiB-like acyl-CoA transferase
MKFDWSKITVIELAGVLAGPSVGLFFAQLGARVIKVESASGDVTRHWKLKSEDSNSDRPAYFTWINAGKESITIDFTHTEDINFLHKMMSQSQVVISSFKPGDGEKFGLDERSLLQKHPHLIIGSITAYGQMDNRVGYDALLQAESGFMFLNGNDSTDFHKMPVALIDVIAGHQLIQKLLLEFLHRSVGKKGGHVSVSLFETALQSLSNQASSWLNAQVDPIPMGSEHPNIVPYGSIFQTKDHKSLVIAIGSDHHFEILLQLLDIPFNEEWRTNIERVRNRAEINSLLQSAFAQKECTDWLQLLQANRLPIAPVQRVSEALNHESVQRWVRKSGNFFHWRGPLEDEEIILREAPKLGADTERIKKEF